MAFVVILLLFGSLAALTAIEMATFSARKERMVQARDAGDRRGTMVNSFQRAPSIYLAAIQLLVTAANFAVGAMIGSNLEAPTRQILKSWLPDFRFTAELSWTLAVGCTTILALIFTNVLPKQIGFVRANELALKSAPVMRAWIRLSWPITSLIRWATVLLAKILRVVPDQKHRVTERDIDALLAEGARAGSLDRREQDIMRRALRLSDLPVRHAMVSADRILWIDPDWTPKAIERFFNEHSSTSYPVGAPHIGKVLGILRVQDWFLNRNLTDSMTPPVFANADDSLLRAMELLLPSETRLLLVRRGDEVIGLLTLNDVLAAVVGPIQQT